MNVVVMSGYLTKPIEKIQTKNGNSFCVSTLASNRYYYDSNGERRNKTTFVDVKFFGKLCEVAEKYMLDKGDKIVIEGTLETDQWINKEGHFRNSLFISVGKLEIVKKKDIQALKEYREQAQNDFQAPERVEVYEPEEEIPF